MKLLWITFAPPYPPLTGSRALAFHHIKRLASRHNIDLISFEDRQRPGQIGGLPRWCDHIELIDRPERWRVLIRILLGVLRGLPVDVARFTSPEMTKAVEDRLAGADYDIVLVQHEMMAQFLPGTYRSSAVWSFEAPPVLKRRRELAVYPWYTRAFQRRMTERLERYEKHWAPRFDRIIYLQGEECQEYKNVLQETKIECVPYGIDSEDFCPSPDVPRQPNSIVFTGTMNHPPNVDAVEYLCREIFPLLCKRAPDVTLSLVGRDPLPAVRKWARDPRIRVTGFVADVRPYLRQAMVSVCPMRAKVGTLTKVLEAMACGTPVVTTEAGNYGIDATPGEHLQVADDPDQFVDRIVALLSGQRWQELSQNGRRFVVENFAWEKSAARMEQILEEICAARKKGVASR